MNIQEIYKDDINNYEFIKNIDSGLMDAGEDRLKTIISHLNLSENKIHNKIKNVINFIKDISSKQYHSSGINGDYYTQAVFNDYDVQHLKNLLDNFDYRIVKHNNIDYILLKYKTNSENVHGNQQLLKNMIQI